MCVCVCVCEEVREERYERNKIEEGRQKKGKLEVATARPQKLRTQIKNE